MDINMAAGWTLWVVEVALVVLVWRAGWRWRALLPAFWGFMLVLMLVAVFLGPSQSALASEYGVGTDEYAVAMDALLKDHWLVKYGYLFDLAVVGVLLFMLRRGRELPGPKQVMWECQKHKRF